MKKLLLLLSLLLISGCNSPKEKRLLEGLESEIIKELFYSSHLLEFKVWAPDKSLEKEVPLVITPSPLFFYKEYRPPKKRYKDEIEKFLREKLFGIEKRNEIEKIIAQLYKDDGKKIPKDYSPIKVEFVKEKQMKDGAFLSKIDKKFLCSFSHVGFSSNKTTAVIYVNSRVSELAGGDMVVILKKEFGEWRVYSFKNFSIS